ncbi:MAG: hypothetical protein IK008_07610 [Bacteroidales bacterium]|nr:hypothetical protein [Bacteroidales bacterium]
MKRILTIFLLALALPLGAQNIQKTMTGTPAASAEAPKWTPGQTRYFNMLPGGQRGNVAVVQKDGLPGLWNNKTGQWQLTPGEIWEVYFAYNELLVYTDKNGRSGYAFIQPDFEEMGDISMRLRFPLDGFRCYPNRENPQFLCARMEKRWAVLGADGFLLPACWRSPKEAVEYLQKNHRKPADEGDAEYIMRSFMNWGTTDLHISAIGREPGKRGALISLEETPTAGPYYVETPADFASIECLYSAFSVVDGQLVLNNAVFIVNDTDPVRYDDYMEAPVIPLNQVTLYASRYPAAHGSDGGLFFGSASNGCYGLHLRKDGTFKFGSVQLHFDFSNQTYQLYSHPEWYVNEWNLPVEMTFHEFLFGYQITEYIAHPDDYDNDATIQKARTIYLKSSGYAFTRRYPMKAEGYDAEKGGLKMVFAEDACPPVYIPMTAAQAKALLASVKKYGEDEHVWYYTRGLDRNGYDIAIEAGVGYSGGQVFRYKAED